jgi:hypothetical protein
MENKKQEKEEKKLTTLAKFFLLKKKGGRENYPTHTKKKTSLSFHLHPTTNPIYLYITPSHTPSTARREELQGIRTTDPSAPCIYVLYTHTHILDVREEIYIYILFFFLSVFWLSYRDETYET